MRIKCRKTTLGNKKEQWPFKKAKEKQPAKYHGNIRVKMEVLIPIRGVCALGRTTW